MNTNYANEMVTALIAQIDYLKSGGRSKVIITNGRFEEQAGGRYVYRFDSEFASNLDFENDIDVQIGEVNFSAQIINLEDKLIRLSLPSDQGQRIERASIISSNYRLQEQLKERIRAIKDKPRGHLGDQLLRLEQPDPRNPAAKENLTRSAWHQHLNQQQLAALDCALKNSVTYIWGPPGTGKTKVIASIIDSFNKNNLSVLLLSNTNIATDEALYKTADHFKQTGNSSLLEGKIIRIGTIRHKQLEDEFGQYVVAANIVARKTADLQSQINNYEEQIEKHTQNKQIIEKQLEKFKIYSQSLATIQTKQNEASSKRRHHQDTVRGLEQNYLAIKGNNQRWEAYQNSRRLRQALSLNSTAKFKAIAAQLQSDQRAFAQKINVLETEMKNIQESLEPLKHQAEIIKAALDEYDEKQLSEYLQNSMGDIGKLNKQIDDLKSKAKYIEKKIVQEAKLVATTLTNSYLHKAILEREYDCVIIDEISMSLPPAVWYAGNLARKRVVAVGDFMQLPPIAQYKDNESSQAAEASFIKRKLVKRWLQQDLFQLSGLREIIENNQKELPYNLVALCQQYRMQKPIADLVNHLVYGRYRSGQFALQTDPSKVSNKDQLLSGHNLAICDTTKQKPYVSRTANRSQYCVLHAVLASTLAQLAIQRGYQKVGIVSAYRAQANLIQMILEDKQLDEQVEANTVHSFQGGEKPLMIFDITTSQGKSMYDNVYQEGQTEKMLNVALSRAQEECIIIGDVQAIRKNHSKTSPILSMFSYFERHGFPSHPVEYFSSLSAQTAGIGRTLEKITPMSDPSGFHIFTDEDFYEHFKHDIKEAKKEIIIVSPFMTVKRTSDLMNLLDAARRKKVNVFVMTQHPRQQQGAMSEQARQAIEQLETQDIVVLPMDHNLHQKLAFLDRQVFWSGSLNILSQNDSSESMFRQAPFKNAITQLLENLELDKNVGQIGENKIRKCERCTECGAWYWHEGKQTYCLYGRHQLEGVSGLKESISRTQSIPARDSQTDDGHPSIDAPTCPVHQVAMVMRENNKDSSEFWGCPEYKRRGCRVTFPKR